MNTRSSLLVAAVGVLGAFAAWALPTAWFLNTFVVSIGAGVLLGIVAVVSAKDERPLHTSLKAVSFLFVGTSRPNAVVQPGSALLGFKLCCAFALGLGVGVILLARL